MYGPRKCELSTLFNRVSLCLSPSIPADLWASGGPWKPECLDQVERDASRLLDQLHHSGRQRSSHPQPALHYWGKAIYCIWFACPKPLWKASTAFQSTSMSSVKMSKIKTQVPICSTLICEVIWFYCSHICSNDCSFSNNSINFSKCSALLDSIQFVYIISGVHIVDSYVSSI